MPCRSESALPAGNNSGTFTAITPARTAATAWIIQISKMDPEISDAIKEHEFREAAAAIIKSKHHHRDGSEVSITPVEEEDSIERRLIEDENVWKLKTQDSGRSQDVFARSREPQKIKTGEVQDFSAPERKPKTIMAGCNCGQLFNATFSDDNNPGAGIKIKSYDASGSVTDTYSTGSSQPETYSAGGGPSETYSASGSQNKSYGTQ